LEYVRIRVYYNPHSDTYNLYSCQCECTLTRVSVNAPSIQIRPGAQGSPWDSAAGILKDGLDALAVINELK